MFSHSSAAGFSRGGEKYYNYFADNLLLFQTVKEQIFKIG